MTQAYVITLFTALLFIAPNDSYFAGPSPVSWEDAEAYCESQGSTLASIHSDSDREAASSVCETTGDTAGCHIGLRMFNGAWEWIDGSAVNYGFNNGDGSSVVAPPWYSTAAGDGASGQTCGYIYAGTDPYTFEDVECSGRNDNWGLCPPICNDAPTTPAPIVSVPGYNPRDAGSISCGETKEGTRSTGDDMPVYSYTAVSDRTQVFLEGCNSVHDIWLYLFDDNGQIYNADDQRNHGDQAGCGNWFAGDITVTNSANAPNAVSVSAGSTYYFGIGSWASRTGDYSVYLDCEPEVCGDASGETSLLGIETGPGNSENGGTTSDVYIRFYNDAYGWTNEWFLLDNENCDDFPETGNSWSSFPDATSIIEDVMGNKIDKVALHLEGCDYLFIKTIVVNGITINVNTGSNWRDYGVVCGQDMVYYVDGTKLKSSSESNWVGSTALVSDPSQVTTSNSSPPIYYIELSLNTALVIGGLIAIILLCNIILIGKSFIKKRNNPYQVVKRIDTEYETDENV